MSFKSNQIFEQASKLADCASDTLKDISKEAEAFAQVKLKKTLNSMGIIGSEEAIAIKCTMTKINDEMISICKRLDKLEKKISDLESLVNTGENK